MCCHYDLANQSTLLALKWPMLTLPADLVVGDLRFINHCVTVILSAKALKHEDSQ